MALEPNPEKLLWILTIDMLYDEVLKKDEAVYASTVIANKRPRTEHTT